MMETVYVNQFFNLYRLIQFGFGVRTKQTLEQMCLIEMAGLNKLAPLFCVETQSVTIKLTMYIFNCNNIIRN